jgi:TetR/AcrR family transcriptional repressor of nem operon
MKSEAEKLRETMTKGESTRQEIIRNAAPVFNQQGYAGTSMQDLMAATGLEKGGLYRHFTSKQQLAAEALRYALRRVAETRLEPLADVQDPMEKLRQMIDAFVDRPSPVPGGCPLLNVGVDADDTNPELLRIAAAGIRTWKALITQTVKAGQHSGAIRSDALPSAVANQIIASLEGALLICRIEKNRQPLNDARTALHQLLKDLQPTPSAS